MTPWSPGVLSETGHVRQLLLKHAHDAFRGAEAIAAEWRDLNFTAAPDFQLAIAQYDRFLDLLRRTGADLCMLPA